MSLKSILKESVQGYPWHNKLSKAEYTDAFNAADERFSQIVKNRTKTNWDMALLLADIVERGLYRAYYDDYRKSQLAYDDSHGLIDSLQEITIGKKVKSPYTPDGNISSAGNPVVLCSWAKDKYGISRTQVYSMLEVVDEFCTYDPCLPCGERFSINYEGTLFSFGQLIEMLPIPYAQRKPIQPNWTRDMIREYKKSLDTKDVASKEIPPAELKDKPINDRYEVYKKFSKTDLIDKIYDLESEIKSKNEIILFYEQRLKDERLSDASPEQLSIE